MSNIKTQEKENFNMFTCDFEEFKQWILSQHIIINDSEFEKMKYDVLDAIIDYEKNRCEHDLSGKFNNAFITPEEDYFCLEMDHEFEKCCKSYKLQKEEEDYLRSEVDYEFKEWVRSYKLEKEKELIEKELSEKV